MKTRETKLGKQYTSDYIHFDKAMRVAEKLLKDDKKKIIGLYIIVSINSGMRIADTLSLKWQDLKNSKGYFWIKEGKTKKDRRIDINENIKKALSFFSPHDSEQLVFRSQKGSTYSIQQINRVLKQIFSKEAKELNISSHSLRKSFGRRVYENNGESEKALLYLNEIFQHSTMKITKIYLGIRQEEISNVYLNL
jgi:integrase